MKILFNGMLMIFLMVLGIFSVAPDVLAQSPPSTLTIESDETWKYSKVEEGWWYTYTFNDGHWGHVIAPSNGVCQPNAVPEPYIAKPMWAPNPRIGESVYFRKTFNLVQVPQSALLKTVFDDDGDIYMNGYLVRQDRSGSTNLAPFVNDVLPFLREGTNVIGLYVVDSTGGCQSAQVRAELDMIFADGQSFVTPTPNVFPSVTPTVTPPSTPTYVDPPLFKQTDVSWGNKIYAGGTKDNLGCGSSIKQCGCALSSLAMVLAHHGVLLSPLGEVTSPDSLNDYFRGDQKCVKSGCISKGYYFGHVRWAAANQYSKEAHDIFGSQKVQFIDKQNFNSEVVKSELLKGDPVIVQSPEGTHWFVASKDVGEYFGIHDPFFDVDEKDYLTFDVAAKNIVRYEKTNSDFSSIELVIPSSHTIILKDDEGRETGVRYENGSEVFVEEIPNSNVVFEPDYENAVEGLGTHPKGIQIVTLPQPKSGSYTVDIEGDGVYSLATYLSTKDAELKTDLVEEHVNPGENELLISYNANVIEENQIYRNVNHESGFSGESNMAPTPSTSIFQTIHNWYQEKVMSKEQDVPSAKATPSPQVSATQTFVKSTRDMSLPNKCTERSEILQRLRKRKAMNNVQKKPNKIVAIIQSYVRSFVNSLIPLTSMVGR